MKLKITFEFSEKLAHQIEYIARDKPLAAARLKKLILKSLESLTTFPYANRKSIYFDKEEIRDLIVKKYTITYKINKKKNRIEVFGFTHWEENPFK